MGLPQLIKSYIITNTKQDIYLYHWSYTSNGKTSFGLDIFVYNLIKNAGDKKINILYYSFEMAEEVLYAKLLSRHIWDEYSIIITYEDILSLTTPITAEQSAVVEKMYSMVKQNRKNGYYI